MPSMTLAPTLSRRAAVRLGAGGIAAALAARGLARPASAAPARSTFVLVHGAWAGAWIWKKIIPLLRAAGHDVYATTATGMGDRVHLADPAIDLDTYITDVVNVLEFEDLTDVTLVGWSYGGMIITGVAERVPERLAQLVYLEPRCPPTAKPATTPSSSPRGGPRRRRRGGRGGRQARLPGRRALRGMDPGADEGPGRRGVVAGQAGAAAARDLHPADPARQPGGGGAPARLHLLHGGQGRRRSHRPHRRRGCGRTRPGGTGNWRRTTWRQSTIRRPRPRRFCPWYRRRPTTDEARKMPLSRAPGRVPSGWRLG